MSLEKSINHGREKRRRYYGSKAVAKSCRCHGSCEICREDRLFQSRKEEERTREQMEDDTENTAESR